MSVEVARIDLIYTGRRGRPKMNISEEERLARANEKKKLYNIEHPEKYREVYMRTVEKNREKINEKQKERQRLIRTQRKVLKSMIEQAPKEIEMFLN